MMLTKNQPCRVSFHFVFPKEYQMIARIKKINRLIAGFLDFINFQFTQLVLLE